MVNIVDLVCWVEPAKVELGCSDTPGLVARLDAMLDFCRVDAGLDWILDICVVDLMLVTPDDGKLDATVDAAREDEVAVTPVLLENGAIEDEGLEATVLEKVGTLDGKVKDFFKVEENGVDA